MNRVRRQLMIPYNPVQFDQSICVVLDSGIGWHTDFDYHSIQFADFISSRRRYYDDNGHGTHVCGIIAGNGSMSGGRYTGIAPGVPLAVCKILDSNGEGSLERINQACDALLRSLPDQKHVIMNISIALGKNYRTAELNQLIDKLNKLWEKGVLIVCAAGNHGPGENTMTNLSAYTPCMIVGCNDGAYYRNHPKRCELYSGEGSDNQAGMIPDIVAPGSFIVSCCHKGNGYCSKSGTSMATAIVSGVAARYFQQFPNQTNEAFKNKVRRSAIDLGIPTRKQGFGMINVPKILDIL